MLTTSGFAETAALMGDPARANMLAALMDGRALTASELARAAGVTAQTASGHLARLTTAGLLAVERQGRHRYHRLASAAVAQMLEAVMSVAADIRPVERPARIRTGPRDLAMRRARTCFDHMAGRIAVAMADAMVERGEIELSAEGAALTEAGTRVLGEFGLDLSDERCAPGARRSTRVFCRPCLDWSERRLHIGGVVGAALCARCIELGWVRRAEGSRALIVTRLGERGFPERFGVRLDDMAA